ncbi:MAG TPA: methyltransferase domain-containing protein [Saprospiraceae bacterium]|nr:methyltransferase domain-containing protein [Saprospiraceae bacterium]
MGLNFQRRSYEEEIMDDFQLQGDLLRETLDQLGTINRMLGGNKTTLKGLQKLIKDKPRDMPLHVTDLGCGHGDVIRRAARMARKEGRKMSFTGIDANPDTLDYARSLSKDFPEINYRQALLPSDFLAGTSSDIILCTLFLHHFNEKDILQILNYSMKNAPVGVVINDLHRHSTAYRLFDLLTRFFFNNMVREDGLTSIQRGFSRKELDELSGRLENTQSAIQWKWAFRYQWILQPKSSRI